MLLVGCACCRWVISNSTAKSRKFRPTYRAALLGSWLHSSLFDRGPLTDIAEALRRETRETVSLGLQNGPHMQYVHIVKSSEAVQLSIQVGTPRPMTCAAMGRVLLAPAGPRDPRHRASQQRRRDPDDAHRVIERDFMAEIDEVRRQGYGESRGKMIAGANNRSHAGALAGRGHTAGDRSRRPMERIVQAPRRHSRGDATAFEPVERF